MLYNTKISLITCLWYFLSKYGLSVIQKCQEVTFSWICSQQYELSFFQFTIFNGLCNGCRRNHLVNNLLLKIFCVHMNKLSLWKTFYHYLQFQLSCDSCVVIYYHERRLCHRFQFEHKIILNLIYPTPKLIKSYDTFAEQTFSKNEEVNNNCSRISPYLILVKKIYFPFL